MNSPLFNEKKAAETLGLSVRTLQRMRQVGGGPVFVRLGPTPGRGRVLYQPQELERWVESRRHASTSDDGRLADDARQS